MTEAQTAAATTAEPASRYLDLVEGKQSIYASDLQVERDKETGRIIFKLTLKSAPGHDAPFTLYRVGLPKQDDADFTKVTMDRHVKTVLFPLCALKIDEQCSASVIRAKLLTLFRGDGDKHPACEVKCDIIVEQREGKQMDKNGNLRKFSEIKSLVPTEALAKTPFESNVDYDDLHDIPF